MKARNYPRPMTLEKSELAHLLISKIFEDHIEIVHVLEHYRVCHHDTIGKGKDSEIRRSKTENMRNHKSSPDSGQHKISTRKKKQERSTKRKVEK
ncbi:hypothetical protein BOTCAL_0059g00290 [Botryotinia calthae]|uniref:Uncharacterized protein n=1 Tax=Botryotinia calthae TaxID=38488 RepID=A0A4Y8DAH7_9HELO|nr:hypothetical protein BOTCAL_0059g00290 [Botryotinia calthae]